MRKRLKNHKKKAKTSSGKRYCGQESALNIQSEIDVTITLKEINPLDFGLPNGVGWYKANVVKQNISIPCFAHFVYQQGKMFCEFAFMEEARTSLNFVGYLSQAEINKLSNLACEKLLKSNYSLMVE